MICTDLGGPHKKDHFLLRLAILEILCAIAWVLGEGIVLVLEVDALTVLIVD